MKVLITGGAGFAGSGLARLLLETGHQVRVLDILAPLHADIFLEQEDNPNFEYLWKSVQDSRPEDIEGCDVVIHLAAAADVPLGITSPYWNNFENIIGSQALCEACKGMPIKMAILAGSGNEYGRPIYLPIDEKHPLTPHNPYALSKAGAELVFWTYQRCYGLPAVIMSNGAVCGKGMRREIFIYKWLRNIYRGKPCVLEGGDQTRDLTHVSDVLKAWQAVIEAPPEKVVGQKFQVSYGEEVSVAKLLDTCFEVAGKNTGIIQRPHRPGEQGQREQFNNQKAREVLGYNPTVNYKEAIRRTWEDESF